MEPGFIAERALGYQQLTSLSASSALTIPSGTTMIIVAPQTQSVRWRDDGTDPTASVGYPLAAGSELRYTANRAGALRFIEQTASAAINVLYYG